MITTVMFDMDGTLIPFQQDDFIKVYFGELCKKLAPLGYEPKHTVDSIWAGTKAMIKNDGSRLNSELFWEVFRSMNEGLPDAKELCDEFYTNEFNRAKCIVKYQVDRKPLITKLREKGLKIVLATNPLFPSDGMNTRLSWVGLSPDDFDLVTHYDNCTYCKPFPGYFTEIAEKLGVKPEECVMIGNSVQDDMAAVKAGLKVFLVPEFLENPQDADHSALPQGTLDEAVEYVLSLM
ncbi:MAG: HAD family hydrolase [Oscillospiraceae bacterium]|nr:HAD family hydrolase [Oscillospiraceae bacterium]